MENVLKRAKLALGCAACVWLTVAAFAAGPAMNSVTDTVYRADGTPASGTLLISWPAFTTADGKPVAAGNLSVTIGASGAVAIPLAPNAGASPDGTFYKVVFKLDDIILRSTILVNHSIANPDLFNQGVSAVAGGFADVLNSLHADGIQVQNKQA
jgi:hypothetical protein